jgi:hypothetical protein
VEVDTVKVLNFWVSTAKWIFLILLTYHFNCSKVRTRQLSIVTKINTWRLFPHFDQLNKKPFSVPALKQLEYRINEKSYLLCNQHMCRWEKTDVLHLRNQLPNRNQNDEGLDQKPGKLAKNSGKCV